MEHILYWLWLTGLFGVNAGRFVPLINHFGSVEKLYEQKKYPSLGKYKQKSLERLNNKNLDWAKRIYEKCKNNNINIITYDSEEYPEQLKNIYVPPAVLYSRGSVRDWRNMLPIAVVGTRKATEYGIWATQKLTRELCERGVVIVSGFAKGIDTMASQIAVMGGAYNIAVLACGVDVKYPSGQEKLYDRIVENGLILSEYPPGTRPAKWNFPERNRIIAGLAKGVLVTEAPEKSGALITARQALEENRDVFAVPGKINAENTKGINELLKEGAKPVFSVDDILNEYEQYLKVLEPLPVLQKQPKRIFEESEVKTEAEPKEIKSGYGEITKQGTEGEILKALTEKDMHIDELMRKISVPMNQLNSAIMMLEIGGDIKRKAGNIFHREK